MQELIETRNCHPILVRLAWHDSGTYDQRIKEWPQCGGANGAIRFDPEMNMGANAGGCCSWPAPIYDRIHEGILDTQPLEAFELGRS